MIEDLETLEELVAETVDQFQRAIPNHLFPHTRVKSLGKVQKQLSDSQDLPFSAQNQPVLVSILNALHAQIDLLVSQQQADLEALTASIELEIREEEVEIVGDPDDRSTLVVKKKKLTEGKVQTLVQTNSKIVSATKLLSALKALKGWADKATWMATQRGSLIEKRIGRQLL